MFRSSYTGYVDKRGRLFIPAGIRRFFAELDEVYVRKEDGLVHFYQQEIEGAVPAKIQKRYRKKGTKWERVSSAIIQIPSVLWEYGFKINARLQGMGHYFYMKEENIIP